MEWKCFFTISAYILTACDPVLGATGITNLMLADGLTPNEGRVEYDRSGIARTSACGDGFFSQEASVVCRQLGYEGVNTNFAQNPFGQSTSIDQSRLSCDGDEDNLTDCSLFTGSSCSNAGGVICYESGYRGCFPSVLGELHTLCEYGVQNLTIPKCVSLCYHAGKGYTYAGLHNGDICLCGNQLTTISQVDSVGEQYCASPCPGRDIESCGGVSHIAMFNIASYLQNTNRTASPPECAEQTPTQTTGHVTTTESIQSTPPPSPPPSPSPSSPSSPASSPTLSSPTSSSSPSVPSTDRTTTEGAVSSTDVISSSSSDQTTGSTIAQTTTEGTTSPANVQTDQTSLVMTSDVTSRSRTPTGMTGRTTRGRTTQAGVPSNLGLYIGAGAGGGILLLIIIILLVVFIIRRRRSKEKGSSGDHNILELRLRPEGSDLGDFPPLSLSPNNYSLENGHTNMAADDLTTGTGVEDSDYALIAETDMNPVNSARNGSTYEDVPRLENTSGSRRPPQPVPRKSTKDTHFAMHPVHELYTTPDESQLSNGHRDSIPEYAVSQKFRKEPISQAVPQAPPSALGPEDINGLYTMPDKSRNMTKAKKVLDCDMGRPAGIDNALYICRGGDGLQEGETSNEYATDKDDMGGEDESDGDTGMVENDLYETSHAPTGGDTGMVENDLYETSYRPT